jgi:hypothetical protein
MKNYDLKHIAFHVLVGLYFIWFCVFGVLLTTAGKNVFVSGSPNIANLLLVWISLNFIMGIPLFIVLQLYKNRSLLNRIIQYSFYGIASIAVCIVFLILNKG